MTRRHHGHDPDRQAMYTRRRLLVAGAVAAVPIGTWWTLGGSAAPPQPDQDAAGSGGGSDGIAAAVEDPPAIVPDSTAVVRPRPTLNGNLAIGHVDRNVGELQQRLIDLAFDPGPVDDHFGETTVRSVWAFEKLVMGTPRESLTGVVTAEFWERLFDEVAVRPRRTPGGTHLEVYLPEQVAILYQDAAPRVISHVSSGEGVVWCDEVTIDEDDGTQTTKGICGKSITPGGVYHFERKVEGWRNAKLGRLYKPTYFNYGIAIHGATNVPKFPASRGCVRFPMHIAEYLQDLVELGDQVYVFDGVEEPEHYGPQPMIFDWPDPDYTTTTTSTTSTTTTPPTTTPPTTQPATTVPQPPAKTTTTTAPVKPTTTTQPG